MKEKITAALDLIRGITRPFLVWSGWITFLWLVCTQLPRFFDNTLARDFALMFGTAITAIASVWIGGRISKPPESK